MLAVLALIGLLALLSASWHVAFYAACYAFDSLISRHAKTTFLKFLLPSLALWLAMPDAAHAVPVRGHTPIVRCRQRDGLLSNGVLGSQRRLPLMENLTW